MAKQDPIRKVKSVPTGYVPEERDGKTVYVKRSDNTKPRSTSTTPFPTNSSDKPKPKIKAPSVGVPTNKDGIRHVSRPKQPKESFSEDVVMLEDIKPEPPVIQKQQSLRTDLTEIFPDGLEKGYKSYMVPDLETGGGYGKQKNVITDGDGMPVKYDFNKNQYIKTGEPTIHNSMPVQNDTPTIQAPLKVNELDTKFGVVPERLRTPQYNASKVVAPKVDSTLYKGFNELDKDVPLVPNTEFQKEQEKNLAVPQLKKGGPVRPPKQKLAPGGDVYDPNKNIDGTYGNGNSSYKPTNQTDGNISGVIGQNDSYTRADTDRTTEIDNQREAANKKNNYKLAGIAGGLASGIGKAVYQKPTDIYADTKQQATEQTATSALDTAGSTASPWHAISGGVRDMFKSTIKKDKYGQADGDFAKAEDEVSTASYTSAIEAATKGDAAGTIREITGFGKIGRALIDIQGKGEKTTGAWGGLNRAFGNTEKNEAKNKAFTQQLGEVNAANAVDKQRQAIANRNANNFEGTITDKYKISGTPQYDENKRLLLGDGSTYMGQEYDGTQYKAEGGIIKGKGGPKEDKINAKIEGGSFIVPAENAHIAEDIRKKYLGKPPRTKANLNEKGGVSVKLSNGEHKFSKEEKEELLERGVDVNLLAPNAEEKEEKMPSVFPKVVGLKEGGNVSKKTYKELTTAPNNWKGSKEDWKAAVDKSIKEGKTIPSDYKETKVVKAPSVKKSTVKYTPDLMESRDIAINTDANAELKNTNQLVREEKSVNDSGNKQLAIQKTGEEVVAANTNPTKQKSGIADYLGKIDPTMFLGAAQAGLGYNMLKGSTRPVDKSVINPTYDANVNRAQNEARFGFTAENKALLEQNAQNALNDARFSARNFAGGNAGTAFNQERAAINQGWTNALQLRSADQDLRMEKARYADQAVKERANFLDSQRRRAYGDAMDTFQQKQQAGSELVGAGIRNTIGAWRYNKELNAQEEVERQANAYKGTV